MHFLLYNIMHLATLKQYHTIICTLFIEHAKKGSLQASYYHLFKKNILRVEQGIH
jgi:hypothetical protein